MSKFQIKSLFLTPVLSVVIGLQFLLVSLLHEGRARGLLETIQAVMKKEQAVWARWSRRYGDATE